MNRFLSVCLLFALAQSALAQGAGFAEWGTFHDPSKSSVFGLSENSLSIYAGGPKQDLSIELGNMTAPRVMTIVKGDFLIEVDVDGNFGPGSVKVSSSRTPYHGAGILIMQDSNNYIRLEDAYLHNGVSEKHYISYEIRVNGKFVVRSQTSNSNLTNSSRPVGLKFTRIGNQLEASYRIDNGAWRTQWTNSIQMPNNLEVGFAVVNASKKPLQVSFSMPWITEQGAGTGNYRTLLKKR